MKEGIGNVGSGFRTRNVSMIPGDSVKVLIEDRHTDARNSHEMILAIQGDHAHSRNDRGGS
jgi:hypothetical protein